MKTMRNAGGYEVWVWGDRKLEKFRYKHISAQMLKNLAKARADIVSTDGKVHVTVWSDREVEPIWEERFEFALPISPAFQAVERADGSKAYNYPSGRAATVRRGW